MKTNYFFYVLYLLCLSNMSNAQKDGDLIEVTKIKNFKELLAYIKATENRDSIKLDPKRFASFSKVKVSGITYWSDSLKVKGFILQPKKTGHYPSIIYNRGGSLNYGSLTHHVSSVGLGELALLAKAGYVVIASQYRGNGGGEGKEEYMGKDLNDVLNLFGVLEQIPEADHQNVGIFGWSRGGATTFRILLKHQKFKAAAVGGPAIDYVRTINEDSAFYKYWGEFIPNFHDNPDSVMRVRSALYWTEKLPKNIPLLIQHGTKDSKVLASEILNFALKLDKQQINYRLVLYDGADHGISQYRSQVYQQLIHWFNRLLKGEN